MKPTLAFTALMCVAAAACAAEAPASTRPRSPADELPSHIRRLTWFGERADWSHDGTRILFVEKTFGDVYEVEVESGRIVALTHHYPHHGYTRALYLSNGDVLLSGPEQFDPENRRDARTQCVLSVLDRDLTGPAMPLGTKCSEGPAVSRKRLRIAWTHVAAQHPDKLPRGVSQMHVADILYEDGVPKLTNRQLIIDSRDLLFNCTMETQNFRPVDEQELIFSAYGHQGTEVYGVNLKTKEVINYSNADGQYDEPEGIFPDGKSILVECDKHNLRGSRYADIWRLSLDGSGEYKQVTFFTDYPGYRASNPVVSDDGRFMAFQQARSRDAAGVGHGIFIMDLTKMP